MSCTLFYDQATFYIPEKYSFSPICLHDMYCLAPNQSPWKETQSIGNFLSASSKEKSQANYTKVVWRKSAPEKISCPRQDILSKKTPVIIIFVLCTLLMLIY